MDVYLVSNNELFVAGHLKQHQRVQGFIIRYETKTLKNTTIMINSTSPLQNFQDITKIKSN
jgi:hypothetical protein